MPNLPNQRYVSQKVETVRRFYRFWATFDPSEAETYLATNYQQHPPQNPSVQAGRENFLNAVLNGFSKAFSEVENEMTHCIMDGNFVGVRGEWSMVHSGEFFGAPPSGNRIHFTAFDLHRLDEKGLVAETWHLEDYAAIMNQLQSGQPADGPNWPQNNRTLSASGSITRNFADVKTRLDTFSRFYNFWTTFDTSDVNSYLDTSYQQYPPQNEKVAPGRDNFLQAVLANFAGAFSDIQNNLTHVLMDGDYVYVRGEWSAVHSGDAMGMPATNKKVSFTAFDLHRIAGGRVVETWHLEDFMGIMNQIQG